MSGKNQHVVPKPKGAVRSEGARKKQKRIARKLKLSPVLETLPINKAANWLSITRTAESHKKTATVTIRFLREDNGW